MAFLPYLLFVIALSRVSLPFIMASHRLWISVSWGHSSSGLSSLILLHLSFHMKWAFSEMRIWYIQFTPFRSFPSRDLNWMKPHLVILPIFRSLGHDLCFLSHRCLAFFHTVFWPGMSHSKIICSRSSVVPHFPHVTSRNL